MTHHGNQPPLTSVRPAMRLIEVGVAAAVVLAACSDDDSPPTVALDEARACGLFQAFFVTEDEQHAVSVVLPPDLFVALEEPTVEQVDLVDMDAALWSGDDLSGAGCTDDPSPVDDEEPIATGTLTITLREGTVALALHGATTASTIIEDAAFEGLPLEPPGG